ncbi:hypothetical protein BAE44_0001684 [Dichanthelium oligosanthes]|uniref:Uncharacterized protein n=1 Tax=Dichanthelium oligosanthes TaxID=888268 RepID=A0A1E5WIS3_9POAL|nr:hypothetical protein BAE44_0001684 [Dichanthelium oligosanthes]
MKARLKKGGGMVVHFRVSWNYFSLRPGEEYAFDPERPMIHPKSDLVAGHAAMTIGVGHGQSTNADQYQHMVIQNSLGKLFGIDGIGSIRINDTGVGNEEDPPVPLLDGDRSGEGSGSPQLDPSTPRRH